MDKFDKIKATSYLQLSLFKYYIRNYAERIDGHIYDNQIVFLIEVENGLITKQKEFLDTIMVNELFCGPLAIN